MQESCARPALGFNKDGAASGLTGNRTLMWPVRLEETFRLRTVQPGSLKRRLQIEPCGNPVGQGLRVDGYWLRCCSQWLVRGCRRQHCVQESNLRLRFWRPS